MAKPIWISEELALTVHQRQLSEHSGMEGVRDTGMLLSCPSAPAAFASLFQIATDYRHTRCRLRFWNRQKSSFHRRQQTNRRCRLRNLHRTQRLQLDR